MTTLQAPPINISSPIAQYSPAHTSPDTDSPREGRLKANGTGEGRPSSKGLGIAGSLIRNVSKSPTPTPRTNEDADEKQDAPAITDPLSQTIYERTRRTNTSSSLRSLPKPASTSELDNSDASSSMQSSQPPSQAPSRSETGFSSLKEKKNRVSFLSRFKGSKKKEAQAPTSDNASVTNLKRPSDGEAAVFSEPIGYIPRFPDPPKYVKVKARGSSTRDFEKLFLAQELRGRTGVEIAQAGGRRINPEDRWQNSNAVWAMEFSRDGKFLAAGGHDHIVRVWGVIATPEDRQQHEDQEKADSQDKLNAPVFKAQPVQEYEGHKATTLDLSWSKNNFLLSSSMDKTVRLWHATRPECLCCFKHGDIVTSIEFHPRDDRFFIAGSLDTKLRLWSIPDKSVAYSEKLNELVTSVAFTPDGKTIIAGTLSGQCMFYDTDGLKYHTQMQVRSAHGKNAKGSKITGIQAINYPADDPNGETKLLITSNDSRVRVYNLHDKSLIMKIKGNENSTSQIRASFSEDARYIVCGSEDKKAYIWPTGPQEQDRDKEKRPMEMFEGHSASVTAAIMAPAKTRQLLQASGDPLFELCNPPPVTLRSRAESMSSSTPSQEKLPTSASNTPVIPSSPKGHGPLQTGTKPEESPAYLARCSHPGGNIIVAADYDGRIKVFRQDCAYKKRAKNNENWDNSSTFSKKVLGRTGSVATRSSRVSKRDSSGFSPTPEVINSWRQSIDRSSLHSNSISHRSSRDNIISPRLQASSMSNVRSPSPRKSLVQSRIGHDISSHHHSNPQSTYQPRTPTTTSSNPSYTSAVSTVSNTASTASDNSHIQLPNAAAPNPSITAAPCKPIHPSNALFGDNESNPLYTDAQGASNLFWSRTAQEAGQNTLLRVHSVDIDGKSTDGEHSKDDALSKAGSELKPDGMSRRSKSGESVLSALTDDEGEPKSKGVFTWSRR